MSDTMVKYNTLNLQALMSKKSKIVASEEALREVKPVSWSDGVIKSRKKIAVKKGMEEYCKDKKR